MKPILSIILMFGLISCATNKQKSKEAEKTEISVSEIESQLKTAENLTNLTNNQRDSAVSKTDIRASKEISSVLQNLTLKNSGKCLDGGEIRFLKISDSNGNITEVPVNDNTELNYSNSLVLEKENEVLKIENTTLKNENTNFQSRIYELENSQQNNRSKIDISNESSKLDVERNSFMSYVWTVIITILLTLVGRFLIKIAFKKSV